MTIETEIAQFLRARATPQHLDEAHRQNLVHPMVVYAETHVGDFAKARFFAELVRRASSVGPDVPAFHASERFADTPQVQVELQNYLWGAGHRRLTGFLASFRTLLDAAAAVPGHAFAVICADDPTVHDGNQRNRAIFDAFVHSLQRHDTLDANHPITFQTHGHFLLGAFHAGHVNVDATSATRSTTQLLETLWRDVYVIRLYVDVLDGPVTGDLTQGITMAVGEGDRVFPLSADTPETHLLPVFRAHDGGRSFFVEIRGQRSVFSRLRNEITTTVAYDGVFDAILYLNDPLPPGARADTVYEVVRGDTLSGIAAHFYGNPARWREIYVANRKVIGGNPDRISPGQKLVIPGTGDPGPGGRPEGGGAAR